jgi:hypothetical protein
MKSVSRSVLPGCPLLTGHLDKASKKGAGTDQTVPQIIIGITPRLPQPSQVCQPSATGLDRGELVANMTALFSEHIHVAVECGQEMDVLMTLGQKASMEGADRCDMTSRFLVQSFLCAADAAHTFTSYMPHLHSAAASRKNEAR